MDRIKFIRNEEKKYHDFCYDNYKLFEKGSWLYKPVNTVMELLTELEGRKNLRVLDLGSGVGRNSIPIAQKIKKNGGKVVCVDFLDSAINKLKEYSNEFDVSHVIVPEKSDIGNYRIKEGEYDFIVAVSSLEHVSSEDVFENILYQMAEGTRANGLNCIIVNTEVKEAEIETNRKLDAMMEINIPTEEMLKKLDKIYSGWEKEAQMVKPLEYQIVRNDKPVLLTTNAITYAVRKRN